MLNQPKAPRTVLGVYVTPQAVEAVLMRPAGNYAQVLHRVVRNRVLSESAAAPRDYSAVLPGMKSSSDTDFTIEVGGSSDGGGGDVDFELDFGGDLDGLSDSRLPTGTKPFNAELREILAECAALGYDSPDVGFCVGAPDVAYVELTLSPDAAPEEKSGWEAITARLASMRSGWSDEEKLLHAALDEAHTAPYDPRRVVFVPMTSDGDVNRFLAIVPASDESVSPTVKTVLAAGTESAVPGLLEAESSLLAYYVDRHLSPNSEETTAVVRVGTDDTLLLLLKGTDLHYVERLRSLTSFDPAEMICSRVLLHQDEAKVAEVDHVLIVGGPRDERLQSTFATFFPDAGVQSLHVAIHDEIVDLAAEFENTLTPNTGPAMVAALRLIDANKGSNVSTNLFAPSVLRARRRSVWVSFSWHTALMLVLLFATTLFFSWRFMERQNEVSTRARMLAMSPAEMPALSPTDLRARVDSLNAVHAKYNRALYVLDSLLVGSDEWSRTIERTAQQTGDISGLWFDNWTITPTTIQIQGSAMKRSNLAALARSLDGTVEELKFADVEGARVYPFTIRIARSKEMPEVATKLRDRAVAVRSSADRP